MTSPGIVIVTYNSADVIGRCLDACLQIPGARIVVVDNASEDDTVEIVSERPSVQLVANVTNRGFASAVNEGFAALDTDVVLILNPDAVPCSNLDELITAASAPGIGAAGGRLVDSEDVTQQGFTVRNFPTAATLSFEVLGINRIWPGNPVNCEYRVHVPLDRVSDVDQPAGAFLMVRRCAWRAIDGFDELFHPLWFEDVDFCKRLRDVGYRIRFVPSVTARHLGGHSAKKLGWRERQLFWYGSLLRYAAKHFRPWSRWTVGLAVILGSLGRMLISVISRSSLEPASVYSRVIYLACSCCLVGERMQLGRYGLSDLKENR
jgi:GT2 family glycosyltransferase